MRATVLIGLVVQAMNVSADILSIDLGSQFTKVALVSTGKFEIVHNLQSKRKTPTSISFKSAIREFGDDAILASVKNPSKVASFFRWLVGANTTVEESHKLYPQQYSPSFEVSLNDTRKSVIFGNEEYGQRPIEETLAHIIWYSKNLVEEHDTVSSGKHKIGSLKDLVITVPSWATKRERQAVIDAAQIAGFTHISLVHETSSAVVQRALELELSRNGTTTINTIYFNMGSSHFEACIINYGLAGNTSNIPTARTLACAHSLSAGGIEITKKVAQVAAENFVKKHPKLAEGFKGDLASKIRLLRQAESSKQTLSANKETIFSVESIYEEQDLKHPFFRADIEEYSKPVLAEIDSVIDKVLAKAGLDKKDIHQAEVIGGGWRVPCIQSHLEKIFQPLPLGQHLNGDESIVFGGAYIAANSSSSYRVRKVVFTDISENEYSLQINPRTVPSNETDKWPKTQVIFPVGQKLGSSKQVKLSSLDSDFDLTVFENGNVIEIYRYNPQYCCKSQIRL
jgi:hypoxia up-regulated 1